MVPTCPAAGVSVTVGLPPLPPKTMLAFGTRSVLEEEALTVSSAGAVSASLMVKGIAAVETPGGVALSVMSLMVGALLAGLME